MVLGQKLGFDHSFLFASHPLLSNTSVAQPMCKENKEGLFARMHPTNCHKVEAASQRRKKGTNACFLQPFQARYFYPPPPSPASSLLFKSTKLLSPPTHQLYKCSALSRMNLRHTCSRVNSPQAQVADALSMLESVTESNIPTSCSDCRPRRTKSTTYNYYKGEGGRGEG